ncbi:repeat protein [Treponema primitia ZAS-2]|uniref:Repeat protein n=1 Tax=Treponema primitia (strain ATCC BAA-887 / DSM 12427 / ZAS-2) TaxID=545694 RepID=F5YRB4_TREPZ|nr:InlB B-repeat-containing protein [Treponema primitia]AEF86194.1 repeat protein [Treponema primitia ZAS-2]
MIYKHSRFYSSGVYALLLSVAISAVLAISCESPTDPAPTAPVNTYMVIFSRNGGDTDADPQAKTVTSPATTVGSLPSQPVKAGSTFVEWNTEADGSGSTFFANTGVTGNITVYAKWSLNPPGTYTVSFNKNSGDTEANPQTKTVISPATVDALPSQPTKAGYTFVGWNTRKNGSGSAFTATTPVTGDITVYAKWQVITYTVSFNNNNGDTEADLQTKIVTYPATTIDSLPSEPTRAEFTFIEWNTQEDGSGTAFTAATPVTDDITVYAKWNSLSAIILSFADSGSGVFSQESFTVIKSGTPASQAIVLAGSWTKREWYIDGGLRGNGVSLTVNASDYTLGGHILTVTVYQGTIPWTKRINFTVKN